MRSLGRAEWPSGTDDAVPWNHWEPLQHVLDRERLCIKMDGKRNQPQRDATGKQHDARAEFTSAARRAVDVPTNLTTMCLSREVFK
jgi:hypothetical protein